VPRPHRPRHSVVAQERRSIDGGDIALLSRLNASSPDRGLIRASHRRSQVLAIRKSERVRTGNALALRHVTKFPARWAHADSGPRDSPSTPTNQRIIGAVGTLGLLPPLTALRCLANVLSSCVRSGTAEMANHREFFIETDPAIGRHNNALPPPDNHTIHQIIAARPERRVR